MSTKKRAPSSSSSPPPPAPGGARRKSESSPRVNRTPQRRRSSRERGYAMPREKNSHRTLTILLCVFHSSSQGWRSKALHLDKRGLTDAELWTAIRDGYRNDLQKPWRRWLLFRKLKHIVPIAYTANDQPIRTDPKQYPDAHEFMHCYHHPQQTKTHHQWVDWFIQFQKDPSKTYGLEFVEGLWADKLALLAILTTIAVIVVSVVWCALGGQLQTVFTVMSFVLGGATAEVALVALYYQVTLPG